MEEGDGTEPEKGLKELNHFIVGSMSEEFCAEKNVKMTKEFVYCVSELAFSMLQSVSRDLECFAQHAKRSTVQKEDLLLSVRKNASLQKILNNEISKLKKTPATNKRKLTKTKCREKASPIILSDSDDSEDDTRFNKYL